MKKLGMILCLVGMLLIVGTVLGTIYNNYKQSELIENYQIEQEVPKVLPGDINATVENNEVTTMSIIGTEMGKMMATLKIPSIDVEVPLVEGDRKQDLKLGAGHLPGTALPGEEGNCAIAGHRSYTFGKFFNRLNEVKVGDEIIIENQDTQLTYKVEGQFIVKPEEVWVLDQKKGEHTITLITCDPIMKATHRLIIRGSLLIENSGVEE